MQVNSNFVREKEICYAIDSQAKKRVKIKIYGV